DRYDSPIASGRREETDESLHNLSRRFDGILDDTAREIKVNVSTLISTELHSSAVPAAILSHPGDSMDLGDM
ncbi:hypothetical protein LTS06_012099, partial [Exophiala xenobiotica]